jgi:hypothetical protein
LTSEFQGVEWQAALYNIEAIALKYLNFGTGIDSKFKDFGPFKNIPVGV